MALSCNTKLVYPPQDVLEKNLRQDAAAVGARQSHGELAWPAMLRKLDRGRYVVPELGPRAIRHPGTMKARRAVA